MEQKQVIKDTGFYSFFSYGAQFVDVLNGVLVRNFLGPESMGVWAFLQVIVGYAKHSALGITTATTRDVPYYRQKGEYEKAEEVKNVVFTFTTAAALLIGIGICVFAFFARNYYPKPITYGLIAVSFIIVLQRIYNHFVVLLRAYKEFLIAGTVNFGASVLSVVLTVLLVWKLRLYGLFLSVILNYVFMTGYIIFKTKFTFSLTFDRNKLKPLMGLGIAIMISDLLRTMFMSADRILITKYLGFEALGLYSVALMAHNYLYGLPNMLGVVLFPRFQEAYASSNSPAALSKYMEKPTLCIAYCYPLLIGLVWVVAPHFVRLFLPEFIMGVVALKYLILGTYFLGMTHVFNTFLVTVRKHWLLIPSQAAVVIFAFSSSWFSVKGGWGIAGIAVAMTATFAFFFLILSLISLAGITQAGELILFYSKIFSVFAYETIVLMLLDHVLRFPHHVWLEFLVHLIVLLTSCVPLFYFAEKEIGIITTLRSLFIDVCRKLRLAKNS